LKPGTDRRAFNTGSAVIKEKDPDDTLNIGQGHLLYRMSFTEFVEWDIGPGFFSIDDEERTTGFSMTLPLRIAPSRAYSLEWRPQWAWLNGNVVQDYGLSLKLIWKAFSVQSGYRWLRVHGANLDGPFVGAAVHF